MEYIRLGLTETYVSRIAFGCAAIGGYDYGKVNDRESIRAVRKALDLGINFFDTADVYGFGHSEEILAEALGAERHNVIIGTKFGVRWDARGKTYRDISSVSVAQALEASLRRLRLDCIPLYQIHWPDQRTDISETMHQLMRLQESGKIRFIGCCNFPSAMLREAQAYCRSESIQLPFSLLQQDSEHTLAECRQTYSMSALCYNVLAQGFFSGKYGLNSQFDGSDLRRKSVIFQPNHLTDNLALLERIRLVADRYGKTPAQVAIRWVLDHSPNSCALAGIKQAHQAAENAGAAGWKLSDSDLVYLQNVRPMM